MQQIDELKEIHEQEIIKASVESQNMTLQILSAELHDDVGQQLAALGATLVALQKEISPNGESLFQECMSLLSNSKNKVRDLSREIYKDVNSPDLLFSINKELQRAATTQQYKTVYLINNRIFDLEAAYLFDLSQKQKILIFRIFQEALSNIIKHAHATAITVSIHYTESLFEIIIGDNGCGIEKKNYRIDHAGIGLNTMKVRSKLLHGTFSIKNDIPDGTIVRLIVPLNTHKNAQH